MPPNRPINFLPPPYPYFLNVDVSKNKWNIQRNVIICEIRCVAPEATDNFEITVELGGRVMILRGRGENIWRVQIDRIRRYGTTPIIRKDCIEIYGYYADSIAQYTGV